MAKKLRAEAEPAPNLLKQANTSIIGAAIKEIEELPTGAASIKVLTALKDAIAGKPWFRLEQPVEYTFAEKLFENRRWLMPSASGGECQKAYPPGTTFLGIVLDRTLEVSVVEPLTATTQYHRPMAVLPKGSLFGTFETADLMCQTQPIQNYTVFSGLRTFFFSDPKLDPRVTGNTPYHNELKELSEFDLVRDLAGATNVMRRRPYPGLDLTRWKESSPTESALLLLKAILGAKLREWKSRVLVIPIGSDFLTHATPDLKQLIWRSAWHQSEHLRRQAIESYSTDRVVEILEDAHRDFRSAISRELKTLPALLTESRPGFRKAQENGDSFGPFPLFFSDLKAKLAARHPDVTKEAQDILSQDLDPGTYIPQLLYDEQPELIFPIWPNFDPSCARAEKHKGPALLDKVGRSWFALKSELLPGDWSYSKESVKLEPPSGKLTEIIPILRWPLRIENRAPRLPMFSAVPTPTATLPFAGIIGVQHLMEETLCLVDEINRRQLCEPQNIWLLGKPYSSSARIAHRLSQLGAKAHIPNTATWDLGSFDARFEDESSRFLTAALASLPKSAKPLLLLDDGGVLLKAARRAEWSGGFRGVEQTSRGIAFTLEARFPIVLVACSALKSLVEPEFVARAAVRKLALYYPEALRSNKVGIIGLGGVGSYFADYVINRHDIHHGVQVIGFDPDKNQKPFSAGAFQRRSTAADVFKEAEVVYGCSGEDLGPEAKTHGARGQLLISLSSGDIEFASLLRKTGKPAEPMLPVEDDVGRIIANSGFPITFDGASCSAPLVEMQVTRALLLAAIQQSLSETKPGHRILDAEMQWTIWDNWNKQVLQPSGDPSFAAWREQRHAELGDTTLFEIPPRVGDKATFTQKNEDFFSKAVKRAKDRLAVQRAQTFNLQCPTNAVQSTSKRHSSTG